MKSDRRPSNPVLDTRGFACPIPSDRAWKALRESPERLTVLVDDPASREELTRLARRLRYRVAVARRDGYDEIRFDSEGDGLNLQPPASSLKLEEPVSPRTEALLAEMERLAGKACPVCARAICGHEAVISVAMGYKEAPRCLACLAVALDRPAEALRDDVADYIAQQACYRLGWKRASAREGFSPAGSPDRPGCLWPGTLHP